MDKVIQSFDLFSSFIRASISSLDALGGMSVSLISRCMVVKLTAFSPSGIWGPLERWSIADALSRCSSDLVWDSVEPFFEADGKSDVSGMTGIVKR